MTRVLLLLLALVATAPPAHANDTLATPEALIACVNEEPDLYACARPFICQPDHAFFHRYACARDAAASADAAVAHFQAELAPVLVDLDARTGGTYTAAETEAHAAWEAYRDANCRGDRTAPLVGVGVDEAQNYCRIGHALRRLEVLRADLDRYSYKLAAE